ncbi:hypothetical protein bpr_II426 (plasmid) [Butyrivibrio proteoclasticus B316]|uniref:Uncharacterized protein n=1 Tax=Butyrivibrio proteoclasticus (strain ATCC 51982 / DSM 14932 / B316) TaxID=515622 RepID=E0S4N0_BUTPB|nr:hypothetical protein [Butyrivibrio proteoclasticus]ADL36362.1 hypothetical protein bpr_II426 [Butyrivibrio proteoclasticus B316]
MKHNIFVPINDRRKKDKNMDRVIYIVPDIYEKANPWLFCNFARMKPNEERCLNCKNKACRHQGEHTLIRRNS